MLSDAYLYRSSLRITLFHNCISHTTAGAPHRTTEAYKLKHTCCRAHNAMDRGMADLSQLCLPPDAIVIRAQPYSSQAVSFKCFPAGRCL